MKQDFVEPLLGKSIEDTFVDEHGIADLGINLNASLGVLFSEVCGCGCCGEIELS